MSRRFTTSNGSRSESIAFRDSPLLHAVERPSRWRWVAVGVAIGIAIGRMF